MFNLSRLASCGDERHLFKYRINLQKRPIDVSCAFYSRMYCTLGDQFTKDKEGKMIVGFIVQVL